MHARFAAEGKAGRHDAQRLELLHMVERRPPDDCLLPQSDRAPDRNDRRAPRRSISRSFPTGSCRARLAAPIAPQRWHFRQSIDYSVTANRAVLDTASRYREPLLFDIYRMGRNSIERGRRDRGRSRPTPATDAATSSVVPRSCASRRPRVHPSRGSAGFSDGDKFVDALLKTGVAVHRATAASRLAARGIRQVRTW